VTAPAHAIIGRVRKAHGIHGEVVVETITSAPEAIFASGRRVLAGTVDGELTEETLTVRGARDFRDGLIVDFEELDDRNAADLWRDRYLLVPVEELVPPAADEVYFHDLIGMRVEHEDGADAGTVIELYELPQGLVLEMRRADGTDVLIPYRTGIVARVDESRRTIIITPPDGLLE